MNEGYGFSRGFGFSKCEKIWRIPQGGQGVQEVVRQRGRTERVKLPCCRVTVQVFFVCVRGREDEILWMERWMNSEVERESGDEVLCVDISVYRQGVRNRQERCVIERSGPRLSLL